MISKGDWRQRALGECIRLLSGGTPSKSRFEFWDGDLPWVSCKDMKVARLHDAQDHLTDLGAASGTRVVPTGTILIVVRGMILAKEFPIAKLMRPMAFNQDLKAVEMLDRIDNDFMYYWFLANSYQIMGIADEAAHGTKRLQTDRLLGLEVHFPPLEIQRKIAAILSAYDDLIENNLRRIKILEEMAQSLFREWFVRFRFPGHEKVRMVESPFGKIPKGWALSRFGDIAVQVREGVMPDQVDPETPYLGLEHLPRKSITLAEWGQAREVQSTKLLFRRGDILFGKIRPYFHKVGVAPLDGVCSSDTIVMRPKASNLTGVVLGCASSVEFVDHATATSQGTKMPRANWEVLADFKLTIPPMPILGTFNTFMSDVV